MRKEWSSAGELITNLYRPVLTAGITHKDFWDLSVREITQAIQAKNEYDKAHTELNERLMCAFAYSIGQPVAIGVNAPRQYPHSIEKTFPLLFPKILSFTASSNPPVTRCFTEHRRYANISVIYLCEYLAVHLVH